MRGWGQERRGEGERELKAEEGLEGADELELEGLEGLEELEERE